MSPFKGRLETAMSGMVPVDFVPAKSVRPGDFIWRASAMWEVERVASAPEGQVTITLIETPDLLQLGVAHYANYRADQDVLRLVGRDRRG